MGGGTRGAWVLTKMEMSTLQTKEGEWEGGRQLNSKSRKQAHCSMDVKISRDPLKMFNHSLLSSNHQVPHNDKVLIIMTARRE